MNFKWVGPLALLAALVIGDQIRINRPGHKYRLTVELETPEGVKSASSVMAVHPDRSYSRGGRTRTHRFDLTFRTLTVRGMTKQLERAGFDVHTVLGDYAGRPWDERADVWIILARRKT